MPVQPQKIGFFGTIDVTGHGNALGTTTSLTERHSTKVEAQQRLFLRSVSLRTPAGRSLQSTK